MVVSTWMRGIGEARPTQAIRDQSGKLTGIDAGRGVAAILVVLYHVARHLDQALGLPLLKIVLQFGHAGVDFFFVLSGFVILHAHHADIGRPSQLPRYAGRRLTRVIPTYWVALAMTVGLALAAGHGATLAPRLIASVLPIPSSAEMIVGGAWTLQHEFLFYTLFACSIVHRSAGLACLAVWLALSLAETAGVALPGFLAPQFGSPYNTEFFLGMSAAWLLKRCTVPHPWFVLTTGLGLFATAALLEDLRILDGYAPIARLAYGVPSTLVVLGLVEVERRHGIQAPPPLRLLGAASYSIYLFQFILIAAAWQFVQRVQQLHAAPAAVLFTILVLTATFGGIAASRWIEQPLIRLIRMPNGKGWPARLAVPVTLRPTEANSAPRRAR